MPGSQTAAEGASDVPRAQGTCSSSAGAAQRRPPGAAPGPAVRATRTRPAAAPPGASPRVLRVGAASAEGRGAVCSLTRFTAADAASRTDVCPESALPTTGSVCAGESIVSRESLRGKCFLRKRRREQGGELAPPGELEKGAESPAGTPVFR